MRTASLCLCHSVARSRNLGNRCRAQRTFIFTGLLRHFIPRNDRDSSTCVACGLRSRHYPFFLALLALLSLRAQRGNPVSDVARSAHICHSCVGRNRSSEITCIRLCTKFINYKRCDYFIFGSLRSHCLVLFLPLPTHKISRFCGARSRNDNKNAPNGARKIYALLSIL